jgi:selenocysteine lyase/cysteine desulfurase
MYSPRLLRRMGISPDTGAVRASLVHYNTRDEIHRFAEVLRDISEK